MQLIGFSASQQLFFRRARDSWVVLVMKHVFNWIAPIILRNSAILIPEEFQSMKYKFVFTFS